jgi:hypothetical protein
MAVQTLRNQLTLVELAKRTHDGNLVQITEILNQVNEMLDDAIWIEANGITTHKATIRTSLPTGTWRRLNMGVPSEASSTRQILEGMGMLESYSKVDVDEVDLAPDPAGYRSGEDMAFVEGLSQTLMETIIYGNALVDPEQFNGFATRYNALSMPNVWGGGGTGSDLTSIWLVQWDRNKVHMIYPRNSRTMGIRVRDLGEDTVSDGAGGEYQAYRTHFKVNAGMVVRDYRCVQRYCNIETSGSSNIFDDNVLIAALNQMPNRGRGAVIYANRTILTQMDQYANDKTNVFYSVGEEFGRPITYFRGIPVKLVEKIVDTEDAVA